MSKSKKSEVRDKFVEAMAKGATQTDAALYAGASEKSAACVAVRYMKEEGVKERIALTTQKMREIAAEELGITQLEKMRVLWTIAKDKMDTKDAAVSIKAIAELNKMTNDYDTPITKADVTVNGNAILILPDNLRDSIKN